MGLWNWTCRAVVVLFVMITADIAFGQTLNPKVRQSVSSSHRPWVGLSLGTGFLGGGHVEPDDSHDVGLSLDVPFRPTIRIRVGAGRMGVNGADFGEFPLRRVTLDAVVLVPSPHRPRRGCRSHFVVGGGMGLYHYSLDRDFSETRRGYQVFTGGECVGSRISAGLQLTGRSIHGPANQQLPDLKLFAVDLHVTVKLRL